MIHDQPNMRFVDGLSVLNHSLIRIGFITTWTSWFESNQIRNFFDKLILEIDSIIESQGTFNITIPMLYLEFKKSDA